jgi:hypothetical protein
MPRDGASRFSEFGPAASAFAVFFFCVTACTPTKHTIEPYSSDPKAAHDIEERADNVCSRPASDRPPRRFTTDGCSMFPDDGWVSCCVEHDFEYWCGGSSEDRHNADTRLRECVAQKKSEMLGWPMWAGVRVGGIPWSPFPWRWGYGWDCCRGYDSRTASASP